MISGAGILKNARHSDNAAQFLAFLLSETGQTYFSEQTYEYPVIEGIPTNPLLQPLVDVDALAIDIALNDLSDLAGTAAMLSDLGILP